MAMYQSNPSEPISYGTAGHPYIAPYDVRFKPCHGWTRSITILDDHRLFKRLPQFASWTRDQHLAEANTAMEQASTLDCAYARLVTFALATYGDHGPLISGVIRDHFPVETKSILRTLCHGASRERARSLAHWQASRRTVANWRKWKDSITRLDPADFQRSK